MIQQDLDNIGYSSWWPQVKPHNSEMNNIRKRCLIMGEMNKMLNVSVYNFFDIQVLI